MTDLYFLLCRYENLILVAGGIGISPFLAILSDILRRVHETKPCLPKNILVIWAVKKSNELSLLSAVDAQSSCPMFSERLDLDIQTFVTQQSEPSLVNKNLIIYLFTLILPIFFFLSYIHNSKLILPFAFTKTQSAKRIFHLPKKHLGTDWSGIKCHSVQWYNLVLRFLHLSFFVIVSFIFCSYDQELDIWQGIEYTL